MSKDSFVMEDYGRKGTFASFLPGLSGLHGIPVWCFYVNRGQAVASFGVDTKQNSIMEFYPAHQAYQNVKTTGFRTFLKQEGNILEPFSDERFGARMEIGMNLLELEESHEREALQVRVGYFTLPEEKIGALVRTLTVTNTGEKACTLEVLDGMPALIPCGVGLSAFKEIGQTAKAWMQAEDVGKRTPYYRVRASLQDSAAVSTVDAGNFALGFDEDGNLLPVLADPACLFGYDVSLRRPVCFEDRTLQELLEGRQSTANTVPCAFFGQKWHLEPGESRSLFELYGQAANKEELACFLKGRHSWDYFEGKREQAQKLAQDLTDAVATGTAMPAFDRYCRTNFMDNLLRGGFPIEIGQGRVLYVFSRKHGDLERDYNDFAMLPEYYSQGNGNYRDVSQNRRSDAFLFPYVGRENIQRFYSLIQLDGYNPLRIEKSVYCMPGEDSTLPPKVQDVLKGEFTPGQLWKVLEQECPGEEQAVFQAKMQEARRVVKDAFGEGYWSDHWTYDLDLVEEYLQVRPEEEEALLFEERVAAYRMQVRINPRHRRYAQTERGLRQYYALDENSRRDGGEKLERVEHGKGEVLRMPLLEKLVLLCGVKFAALDAYGMGVEMEGGKPGWYDALNGLPGMLGSSMNETYELARLVLFVTDRLRKYGKPLPVLEELADFLQQLDRINREERDRVHACDGAKTAQEVLDKGEMLSFWNRVNDLKEAYRKRVFEGVDGRRTVLEPEQLLQWLEGFADTLRCGIRKAMLLSDEIVPSYFYYEVPEYEKTEAGIVPLRFIPRGLPHFLEGTVHYLKLPWTQEEKKRAVQAVRESDLYDRKLKMYKVNASLSDMPFELGRATAFLPGWLENESIWLHMEYKYLLELLRSGLYPEFIEAARDALIPFQDPDRYGRSIYENSSFLVSSAYPDEKMHGRGFVARLSGSTAEFISIWKGMMFGRLFQEDSERFLPEPVMLKELIPDNGLVTCTLFGSVQVTYHFPEKRDYYPGTYRVKSVAADGDDGTVVGRKALLSGQIRSVRVEIESAAGE